MERGDQSASSEMGRSNRVHLDNLGHAVHKLAAGKSLEERSVNEDVRRLVESSNEVLAEGSVDGGLRAKRISVVFTTATLVRTHLASYSTVNHGEKSGRDLAVADSAHKVSRDEADEIANNTSAEGQDDGVPGAAVGEHPILERSLGLATLGLLSGSDRLDEPAGAAFLGKILDGCLKGSIEGIQVDGSEVRIGEEDVGGRGEGRQDGLNDVGDEMETAMDGFLSEDGHLVDRGFGAHLYRSRGKIEMLAL